MSEVRRKRVVRRRKPKIKFDKQKYRNLKWAYRIIVGFLFINVLATSVMMYNLVIDCKLLKADGNERYMEPTVNALVKYFGFDREDLITSINERKNSSYWVAKKN